VFINAIMKIIMLRTGYENAVALVWSIIFLNLIKSSVLAKQMVIISRSSSRNLLNLALLLTLKLVLLYV